MKNEPRPIRRTFERALRLICPGWPASVSGKWLTRLWVRDREHDGTKMTGHSYRLPKYPVAPGTEVPAADMAIIHELPVKSVITNPASGLEIPAGIAWLHALPPEIRVISPVENREQRRDARQALQHAPARRLLILCNAALSPDRGSLEWMAALSAFAGETRVCLLEADKHVQRAKAWHDGLEAMGLSAQQRMEDERLAQKWLTGVVA